MEPKDYGLDHDAWRPNQAETLEWAENTEGTLIVEMPTGSGKTAFARALCQKHSGVALMRTKNLQATNYADQYGFTPLYGKQNYSCEHPGAGPFATAADCLFSDRNVRECPWFTGCEYYRQKEKAMESSRTALNYHYWLHGHNIWPAPKILICDEAHQLSDITLDWAGITIDEFMRRDWDLPSFPFINSSGSASVMVKRKPSEKIATDWLKKCAGIVKNEIFHIERSRDTGKKALKRKRDGEYLVKKIQSTISALENKPKDWYIVSGPPASQEGERQQFAFIAKPLTARHHFGEYFQKDWQLLVMSATIGNPDVFAAELGIKDFSALSVPSAWSPNQRPIHALDVPRLGRKASESAWDKQADAIAAAIHDAPHNWHGIVHTTSVSQANSLCAKLASRGLSERVFLPKRGSTTDMANQWEQRKKLFPGSIMVCWAFWEGYDGLDEKINIAAKTPYPSVGSKYEITRRAYDGKFYLQRTAWQLEQGLGRTRRGREEDYDTDEEKRGLVAIADGSWRQIQRYLSPAFMESIV